MIQHQVTHNGVGHLLRALNGGFAAPRRESLNLYDETSLGLQFGGNLVKCIFVALAERNLAGTETQFKLIGRLVLIEVIDDLLYRLQTRAGLLGRHIGLLGAITRSQGVLIGFVGLGAGLPDALGGADVDIL